MKAKWWALVMLAGAGLSGCYRYADVPIERARTMQSGNDGRSLQVELEGGGTQTFSDYDRLVVEIESPGGGETELKLEPPLRAALNARTLRLSTPDQVHELSRSELNGVTLEQHAPNRPYLIAGIAVGAMVLGALAGGATSSCKGEDFCGHDRLFRGLVGATIGLGAGLGIGIPITSTMSSERSGPATDEPWRPHAD